MSPLMSYEMTTFGDMLLGNEYGEGYDTCNFLIKGSRKTTALTEALRRQREEEFRRFETENGQNIWAWRCHTVGPTTIPLRNQTPHNEFIRNGKSDEDRASLT